MLTPLDRLLASRTLVLAALAEALALGALVLTDEAYSTSAMRLARMAAFAPALAAVAGTLVLEQASSRGELRALEALGVPPWRARLGVALGGWALGAAAVVVLLSPWADPTSLFPIMPSSEAWRLTRDGFLNAGQGAAVAINGTLTLFDPIPASRAGFVATASVAALFVAPLALAAPPWACCPTTGSVKLLTATGCTLAAVLLLHAVAARRLPPPWLLSPALPLLAQAAFSHVASRSRRKC